MIHLELEDLLADVARELAIASLSDGPAIPQPADIEHIAVGDPARLQPFGYSVYVRLSPVAARATCAAAHAIAATPWPLDRWSIGERAAIARDIAQKIADAGPSLPRASRPAFIRAREIAQRIENARPPLNGTLKEIFG